MTITSWTIYIYMKIKEMNGLCKIKEAEKWKTTTAVTIYKWWYICKSCNLNGFNLI